MSDPVPALTIQFLTWLHEAPRTYGDVMDAWRTSCPRLSIWEDAIGGGLVALGPSVADGMRARPVTVTERGLALLRPRPVRAPKRALAQA